MVLRRKSIPFVGQKVTFWRAKPYLLQGKRYGFTNRAFMLGNCTRWLWYGNALSAAAQSGCRAAKESLSASAEEHVGDGYGGDNARQVGQQSAAYGVARVLHAYASEVDG